MTATQVVRGICTVLCLVAAALALNFMLNREARLSMKLGWIASLLLVIALAPEKLPFLSGNAAACLFFRNAFGGVFVVLVLVIIFVILWIQLPKEQAPHFDGKVVEIANLHGLSLPRVEFQDAVGKRNIFDDALAPTLFPGRTFIVGEHLVVRAPLNASPHIDHSALARWGTIILLILIAAFTLVLSVACHLRFRSLSWVS